MCLWKGDTIQKRDLSKPSVNSKNSAVSDGIFLLEESYI